MDRKIAADRLKKLEEVVKFLDTMKKTFPAATSDLNHLLDNISAVEADYINQYI